MVAQESQSALQLHKLRDRRDLVSDSKFSCKLCNKNQGRIRDIRKHIIRDHQKDSLFRCNARNKFTARRCNFECSMNFGCFTRHAKREHGEYFDGIESSMEEEEIFSLVIIDSNEKETKHNYTCVLDRNLEKARKKSEIKHRGEFEDKIQENFINGTKAVNVIAARDFYENGLSDWRTLNDKYPRGYKRKVAISSIQKKNLGHYIDLYEGLKVDFFE